MGGNLFNGTVRHNTYRLSYKEDMVKSQLKDLGIDAFSIPFLNDKVDHGDLDLIVVKEHLDINNLFNITQLYPDYAINGKHVNINQIPYDVVLNMVERLDTVSFNYDGLQVDLIMIPEESVDFAIKYHSYNDLGGIIGCITKQLGYSLGREGLFIEEVPIDGYGKYKVYLTKDFQKFCKVFDLDDSIYYGGKSLSNVQEMFNYLKDWKYFNSNWMNPNLMNATRRNRAAKRKVFNEITDISNEYGGVFNSNTPAPELIKYFDQRWMEYQRQENYQDASIKVDKKKAMSLERMVKVLGYEPTNVAQIYMTIADMFGGNGYAREHLYSITDNEFKVLLIDVIEGLK